MIWGRWTEGPIVRLVRGCTNIVWKTLRETWGTKDMFSENGYEIDYRLGGVFMKTDGSPRFIFVYDETNTDPKMKTYSKAPDDYEQENFEQEIENRFLEEEMRRNERRERDRLGLRERDRHPRWHPTFWDIRNSHTEGVTNISDASTMTTATISMPSLHMRFRRWSGAPERERVRGRRVMGREMGKERGGKVGEKVGERMQQQEQLRPLRSLHRLLTSLSHSSPSGGRHGHGATVSRDRRDT